MAHTVGTQKRTNFLPESAHRFIRRRLIEILALALFVCAVVLTLALVSFQPSDPSLNVATGAASQNRLGAPGALVADFLLQWFGLAGALPALVLAAWAWRMFSHRGLPWILVHVTMTPLLFASACGFLAGLNPPENWPLVTGLGGVIGDGVHHGLASLLHWAQVEYLPPWLVTGTLAAIALLALAMTLGIDIGEWRTVGRGAVSAASLAGGAARYTAGAAGRLRARAGEGLRRREPRIFDDGEDATEPEIVEAAKPQRQRRVAKSKAKPKKSRRARKEEQPTLDLLQDGEYQLPPLYLLQEPESTSKNRAISTEALEQNARLLESVLDDYGVRGHIVNIRRGPVVTLYELEPAAGTKTSRVIGLADDIARSMSARSVRIAVVPERNAIGIELPNRERETVFLRELLSTADYERTSSILPLALGKDIAGAPVLADLARMPHLLIAGTTGSGKSVAINTMVLSLLYRMSPDQCRLIMIDPKMLELSVYDGIPHLLTPVVTDPGKAILALKWAVREMENRYRAMASLGVRNIASYNQRLNEAEARGEELTRTVQTGYDEDSGEPIFEVQQLDLKAMPYIVVVVDEMADLMMVAGKEIEAAVQRLAQMARASGIHIMLATQRPSVDVITGTIKANFPTRVSFQVTAKVDSRTILGEQGAEQLLGMGDLLYMANGGRITRVHGPFVSDDEVESVVKFLKKQGRPDYLLSVTEEVPESGDGGFNAHGKSDGDNLFDRAVEIVAHHQKASTSFLQRQLKIGYNRAADLIDRMEAEGIIGRANHVGKREVLVRQPDEEF
jgi:S-DNA-T family DNA segregation ATPase FtsK/SpoIIIE